MLITIFIVGLSGIVAQMVILRELLVNFYGNELTVGIILANWVALEAAGVFILGRFIDRVRNKLSVFISLNVLFSLFLPLCSYFSRAFKAIVGLPFAEALPLSAIFLSSFMIILPVAFLHGGLFSCGCKLYALSGREQSHSIGRMYTWETLGTICGGALLAYLFIPLLDTFQIVLFISMLNLGLAFSLISVKRIRYLTLTVLILPCVLFFTPAADYLQNSSLQKQWQGKRVLDYRNSNYANITVTKDLEQYTFFYNGVPVITTPFPDRQFVEEFANLPLLFHHQPERVLVAASGVGGLIAEVLKHPVRQVDYVEVDPLIIKMLKKYPTALSEKEFSDKRVNIINTDPRIFLRGSSRGFSLGSSRGFNLGRGLSLGYDVILLGLSNQSDLSCNRFFTQEFFELARERLAPGGLLALWMPGSLTYLSRETKDLNGCVLNALRSVYRYVRVIPGDYNIFIASDSERIISVGAAGLSERITRDHLATGLFIPDYLEYRLSPRWSDWFSNQMRASTREINRDLRPIAVYENLKITNKKFSPFFSRLFDYLGYLNLGLVVFSILLATAILFFISRKAINRKIPVVYAIFTTGFFGMSVNLLLIFAYQVFYGYLYQKISLLVALFMAGIAAGSALMVSGLNRIKAVRSLLMIIEGGIAVFSLLLGITISSLNVVSGGHSLAIYILLFIAGLGMGMEFPLAAKLYLEDRKDQLGAVAGLLYAGDLVGGWLAGVLTGVAFLPLLGFFDTCLLIVMLKLSSLFVLCG